MLKRKKFVIQWRKFGLKRSSTFKVMNFWVYGIFLIFKLIAKLIFSYLKSQKGDFLPVGDDVVSGARWRADVARRTTSRMRRGTEATWQGRRWPTQGTGGAHTARTHGRGHTCPHGSTRTPVWGATWQAGWQMKGPRVSGPWLGDWGGNANTLLRPTL